MASNALEKLRQKVAQAKNGTPVKKDFEEGFWKLEGDKAMNGSAIIRFLPGKTEDDDPFVKIYKHGFKGPTGKWYFEDCPTTIGQDHCPACAGNKVLWDSGKESNKEIVRERKRKISYISNILVVSDSKNPENEGKVFLFKYGAKIFNKIEEKLFPQFDDDVMMNPFDLNEGANFKLKMRKIEGYANFDKSEFEDPSEVGSPKEVAKIMEGVVDLFQFVDPAKFKSEEDLQKRYDNAVGNLDRMQVSKPAKVVEDDDDDYAKKVVETSKKKATVEDDDDEDLMASFAALADED
jgi:hypothetical protein